MVKYTEEEEFIINELKRYVPVTEYKLNNWRIIINRKETVKENLFKYSLANMDLYFDDEMIIQEYDKVHIIDNIVYYDFNKDNDGGGTYTKIGEVDD